MIDRQIYSPLGGDFSTRKILLYFSGDSQFFLYEAQPGAGVPTTQGHVRPGKEGLFPSSGS